MKPADFINRWQASGAAERANYQLFLSELAELLDVERPHPKTPNMAENSYVFEKSVVGPGGSTKFIDLYKRGHFVVETKQGVDKEDKANDKPLSEAALKRRNKRKTGHGVRGTGSWDTTLEKAKGQGEQYIRYLPPEELADGGRPPFLIIIDVGHTIDLYAEFTRSGGHYAPFPDPASNRLQLSDLEDEDKQELLRTIWSDPQSLDPARRSARVTREIADSLAQLAKSLEGQHEPEAVAAFLMRSLFTMFAEDVALLPERSFTNLLADLRHDPSSFKNMVEHLWQTMNTGGFSVILRTQIPHFNGGLFAEVDAIPLNQEQIELLAEAASADWRDVEPAIFGTLLERALNPIERHKLGAHYTPRAYVERLVEPTVMEPLRNEWNAIKTAALLLAEDDKQDKALDEINGFLRKLATTKVLDPACGSGNFLYVTLAKMKELEAEVLNVRTQLGGLQMGFELAGERVTPEQFLGIEVNPRAAAIAELVLWIGYLQWHLRTNGRGNIPDPVLKAYGNIECRDAVLGWDSVEPLLDENGKPVTRWDGRTTKTHPVTGQQVPDETAQVQAVKYINPRPAEWPTADYIVGNPPFIGGMKIRESLGQGYSDALKEIHPDIPGKADLVLFWWKLSGLTLIGSKLKRFGLITTNSIKQTMNRRVVEVFLNNKKNPSSIIFAIPDHPWVDTADGADVRIAMTVAESGKREGNLYLISKEHKISDGFSELDFKIKSGVIFSDLTVGVDLTNVPKLKSNAKVCSAGTKLYGAGFIVSPQRAIELGYNDIPRAKKHIRKYLNGRDLNSISRNMMVIDLFGLSESEVSSRFPEIYQHLLINVKPERDKNRNLNVKKNWWIHGIPKKELRKSLQGLKRFISTAETSKHRFFVFLDEEILPDNMLVNVSSDDSLHLGVLSSKMHVLWSLATGGRMGIGNDPRYNRTRCFETFPFPDANEEQKARIRELAEQLDSHRKRQQAQHPKLTLTDMYNVLEKLRSGAELTDKDKTIHEQGLVSILKQIHDDLDAAVFDAYGWPADLTDEEILERLVALNAERAAEEAAGKVRWLRPEYQAPEEYAAQQASQMQLLDVDRQLAGDKTGHQQAGVLQMEQMAWPKTLPDQAQAVRGVLGDVGGTLTVRQVAQGFKGKLTKKRLSDVESLLETLVALGQATAEGEGYHL